MAYTVLARRYRSGTFDEVVGQNHVAQTLKKAIQSGRIAHAFLFTGTRGVGKTSMARILAKALNCHKADAATTEPCQKCDSCQAIARGDDIDVIEIDAASNTGVDNVRTIIENAQYRPARSRHKVYIIDEVHMLSKAAFNALLKTLEEPPEHVKFILATTEIEKVLPTILSRCQRYDFRNIPTREIAEHLKAICKDEKIKADEDALLLVAKAGAGSMRDALSLLDRLLSIGEKHLTTDTIEQLLGLPRIALIYDLAQAIGEGRAKEVLEQADRMITDGMSPDTLLSSLSEHLRNLLIVRTCGMKSGLVEVAGLSPADLTKQAERFDPVVLTQDIAILEELRRQLRSTQAGRALLDATLVRLSLAEQFTSVGELLARVGGQGPEGPEKKKSVGDRHQSSVDSGPSSAISQGRGSTTEARSHGGERGADSPDSTADGGPRVAAADPSASGYAQSPVAHAVTDDGMHPSTDNRLLTAEQAHHPATATDQRNDGPSTDNGPLTTDPSTIRAPQCPVPADLWPRVLSAVEDQRAVHGVLVSAQFAGLKDHVAVIRLPAGHDTFASMWSKNGKKDQIGRIISDAMGQSVGVRFEVEASAEPAAEASAETSPAESPGGSARAAVAAVVNIPPPTARPTDEQVEQFKTQPLIKALMDELGATVVKLVDD